MYNLRGNYIYIAICVFPPNIIFLFLMQDLTEIVSYFFKHEFADTYSSLKRDAFCRAGLSQQAPKRSN